MKEQLNETKLHILLKNLIPTFIGSGFVYLLSVVDGVIIGQGAGEDALGAVSLAVPFIYITLACVIGVSSGGGTLAAVEIGRKNDDEAQNAFMHSMVLSIFAGMFVLVTGVVFAKQIAVLLGANEVYLDMAKIYIYVWAVFAVFQSISQTMQEFFRIDNSQIFVTVIYGIGTVVNIVLDIIFVFGFHKGVFGAALASGISELIMCVLSLIYFFVKKGRFRFKKFILRKEVIIDIILKGIPSSLTQLGTMLIVASMNIVLLKYIGNLGIDSFAIISYVASFAIECFIGSAMGVEPLLAQSHGKRSVEDVSWYFKAGVAFNLICALVMYICFVVFRKQFCILFGASGDVLWFASDNMWKFCLGLPLEGFNSMVSVYLYATERAKEAIVFNILKNLVINYLFISFLPIVLGKEIIMFSFAIYQAVVVMIGVIILCSRKIKYTVA